jgi:hypothetical protein
MTLNSKRPTVPQRQNTDDTQRKAIDDAQEQAVNPQSGTTRYPAVVSFANSNEGAIIHTVLLSNDAMGKGLMILFLERTIKLRF